MDMAAVGQSLVSNAMGSGAGAFTDQLMKIDDFSDLLPQKHELPTKDEKSGAPVPAVGGKTVI